MNSTPPKCSGWRFKGKTKYYLSLTCHKYYKPKAMDAFRRDKLILQKKLLKLNSNVTFENTIKPRFSPSDLRFYGLPQSIINSYYNKYNIHSVLSWQSDVLTYNDAEVLKGRNLVYCAPTGIGKSLVYEILMLRRITYWHGQCLIVLPYISLIEEKRSYLTNLCESNGIYVECFYSGGSQRLDPHIDIAISTVEKANIILNRCLMEGETPRISMLIIDEAQTIESERGYLIELLIIKLKQLNPSIQIVFLSATLPSPHAMGRWLQASVYIYEDHISQEEIKNRNNLIEYLVLQGTVQTLSNTQICKFDTIDHNLTLRYLVEWLFQTNKHETILVFCPTKARCEMVVRFILPCIPPLDEESQREIAMRIFQYNHTHTTKLDSFFTQCLQHGLIFHHAGLTDYERTLAESLFRKGCIRLLAATSTLSAGVNLNVDIVIIDGIQRCKQYYTKTEYKQMIGRTGRMGQGKAGRVYILLSTEDETYYRETYITESTSLSLSLSQSEITVGKGKGYYLRSDSYWRKAILEIVSCNLKQTIIDIIDLLYSQSFFSYQTYHFHKIDYTHYIHISVSQGPPEHYTLEIANDLTYQCNPLLYTIVNALLYLLENSFLLIIMPVTEEISQVIQDKTACSLIHLVTTELGEAVYRSGMNVNDVQQLASSLSSLNRNLDVSNNLQIIYHLTPISIEVHIALPCLLDYIEVNLTEAELQYINRDVFSISVLYALRNGSSIESLSKSDQLAFKRFSACIVVRDLLIYNNLDRTHRLFNLNKGVLQSIQMTCKVFYHMNLKILKCLHYDLLYEVFKSFEKDISSDLTPETINLINHGIELKFALILTSNGYTTIEAIVKEDPIVLLRTMVDHMPWQSAYCKEDEVLEIENEYDKCIHVIEKIKRNYSVP